MERPSKLTGEQGEYIQFLEKKLEVFNSKTTSVKAYLALKKIIDDTNQLVFDGIDVFDEKTSGTVNTPIISDMSLTNKDDKSFDRIFKVVDKLGTYTGELLRMEESLNPEDIKSVEKELLKGDDSVEGRIFRGKK